MYLNWFLIFVLTYLVKFVKNQYNLNDWTLYKICNEFNDGLGRELSTQSNHINSNYISVNSSKWNNKVNAIYWKPKKFDSSQYLTIDLEKRTIITAISTRGYQTEYVTVYTISYSNDAIKWFHYTDSNNIIKSFIGNTNGYDAKINNLTVPIVAKLIRINPKEWNNLIALKVQLYGCKYDSITVSFDGNNLAYYNAQQNPINSYENLFRLKFKTTKPSGVLLYANSIQNNDYYLIELKNGIIHISIDLGSTSENNGTVSIECGSLLDDYEWHDLEIRHKFNLIRVTVDQTICSARNTGLFSCLNIDSKIYVGGVSNHLSRGVTIKSNFYGCIEDMVILTIDDNWLKLRKIDIFNGIQKNLKNYGITDGGLLTYYCPEIKKYNTFTMINPIGYLKYDLNKLSNNNALELHFEFRTFEKNSLLFYYNFQTISQFKLKEFLLLSLFESRLTFELFTISRKIKFQHKLSNLNNGQWHSIFLYLNRNMINLTIDYDVEIARLKFETLNIGTSFYFGGIDSEENYSASIISGFVGCLQNLRINSNEITSNNVVFSSNDHVILNSCNILNRCLPNPCENGGECIQNSKTYYCDCTRTGYTGAVCHTSNHPLSCLDFKLSKLNLYSHQTSFDTDFSNLHKEWIEEIDIKIDIDGSGPLSPFEVHCKFGQSINDMVNITIVNHSTEPETIVSSGYQNHGSYSQKIHYTASLTQIRELKKRVYECTQFIEYKCKGSRLLNWPYQPYGYWTSINNQKMDYWGGAEAGSQRCGCSLSSSQECISQNVRCNCDLGDESQETTDSGFITQKENLPVIKVNFGDTGKLNSQNNLFSVPKNSKYAKYTIGPMMCDGDKLFDNAITFRKIDSGIVTSFFDEDYISNFIKNFDAEKITVDLRFEFKTAYSYGILVSTNGPSGDFLEIKLLSKNEINFSYNSGKGIQVLSIITPYDLNDRNWHLVLIERNRKESILTLDRFTKAHTEDEESFRPFYLKNILMIGSSISYKDGFVGCMRAMLVNGRFIDLVELIKKNSYGVSIGCVGKCKSNPCLNSGVCLEYYDSYRCDCTFTPFRGPICATEIGTHLEANNYIRYRIPNLGIVGSSDETIRAQFSTYLKNGLIMQIVGDKKDEKGNYDFISIELNNNGGLKIKLNYGFDLFEFNSPMYVTNGQNHALTVIRDNRGSRLTIMIDDHKPFVYIFDKASDYDLIFDSPRYIYIGRNDSILDTLGFFGCISRLQFNRIFPLKYAFQEEPDPNIFINGTQIRARTCEIEPYTHPNEPIEIPPERDIKIIKMSHNIQEPINYLWIMLAIFTSVVSIFIFLILFIVIYNKFLIKKKFYLTNEEKKIDASEVNLKHSYDSIFQANGKY